MQKQIVLDFDFYIAGFTLLYFLGSCYYCQTLFANLNNVYAHDSVIIVASYIPNSAHQKMLAEIKSIKYLCDIFNIFHNIFLDVES